MRQNRTAPNSNLTPVWHRQAGSDFVNVINVGNRRVLEVDAEALRVCSWISRPHLPRSALPRAARMSRHKFRLQLLASTAMHDISHLLRYGPTTPQGDASKQRLRTGTQLECAAAGLRIFNSLRRSSRYGGARHASLSGLGGMRLAGTSPRLRGTMAIEWQTRHRCLPSFPVPGPRRQCERQIRRS